MRTTPDAHHRCAPPQSQAESLLNRTDALLPASLAGLNASAAAALAAGVATLNCTALGISPPLFPAAFVSQARGARGVDA